MKQKYTLSIADMHVNVVTEASRESVDKIVGMLDRRMREITLKSKKCPKNEAALLCALEFCADKLAIKEELEALEDAIANKDEEIASAEKKIAKLEEEIAKLRAKAEKPVVEKPVVEKPVATEAPDEEQLSIEVESAPVAEEAPAKEEAPQKKKQSRNKVGSMFDLLTFSDI